jgi:hypothetical protein
VIVVAPGHYPDAVAFAFPARYEESQIAKLAPAAPRNGCLLVSHSNGQTNVWGLGRTRSSSSLNAVRIEVTEPGTVRIGLGPFQPFAVFDGRSNPIVGGSRISLADYVRRASRKEIPGDDFGESQAVWRECIALANLPRLILEDGHGGCVLIVPDENGDWSESLNPFPYRFVTPDTTIHDAIRQELREAQAQGQALQKLSQASVPDEFKNLAMNLPLAPTWGGMERPLRATASLARVDGAVVIRRDLKVLGFGAKIITEGVEPRVCLFQPVQGSQEIVPSPLEKLGGTRHQSAARFTAKHKDAVALVVSQDHHVSVMHWLEQEKYVQVVRNVEWWM